MLRATPRSAASERDDGSRAPGTRRPVRTASRRASMSPARSPPGPVSSRCRSIPIAERGPAAEVAQEFVIEMDHIPRPLDA